MGSTLPPKDYLERVRVPRLALIAFRPNKLLSPIIGILARISLSSNQSVRLKTWDVLQTAGGGFCAPYEHDVDQPHEEDPNTGLVFVDKDVIQGICPSYAGNVSVSESIGLISSGCLVYLRALGGAALRLWLHLCKTTASLCLLRTVSALWASKPSRP